VPADRFPARLLSRHTSRPRKNLFLILLIVPFWTSSLTRTFAWLIVLGNHGPLATVLNQATFSVAI